MICGKIYDVIIRCADLLSRFTTKRKAIKRPTSQQACNIEVGLSSIIKHDNACCSSTYEICMPSNPEVSPVAVGDDPALFINCTPISENCHA